MIFHFTKSSVSNHGEPPDAFLIELVNWGRTASDEIFAPRPAPATGPDLDIYAWEKAVLGPWGSPLHRRAVMLEVLRVLAAFESSWNWNEGRDTTAGPEKPDEMEAGAWQVSANSLGFGTDLVACVKKFAPGASHNPIRFQEVMKSIRPLAMEYAARLLRHTIKANGPVVRHEIDKYLKRESVTEFMTLLS